MADCGEVFCCNIDLQIGRWTQNTSSNSIGCGCGSQKLWARLLSGSGLLWPLTWPRVGLRCVRRRRTAWCRWGELKWIGSARLSRQSWRCGRRCYRPFCGLLIWNCLGCCGGGTTSWSQLGRGTMLGRWWGWRRWGEEHGKDRSILGRASTWLQVRVTTQQSPFCQEWNAKIQQSSVTTPLPWRKEAVGHNQCRHEGIVVALWWDAPLQWCHNPT